MRVPKWHPATGWQMRAWPRMHVLTTPTYIMRVLLSWEVWCGGPKGRVRIIAPNLEQNVRLLCPRVGITSCMPDIRKNIPEDNETIAPKPVPRSSKSEKVRVAKCRRETKRPELQIAATCRSEK
jgi:hypothetical protein